MVNIWHAYISNDRLQCSLNHLLEHYYFNTEYLFKWDENHVIERLNPLKTLDRKTCGFNQVLYLTNIINSVSSKQSTLPVCDYDNLLIFNLSMSNQSGKEPWKFAKHFPNQLARSATQTYNLPWLKTLTIDSDIFTPQSPSVFGFYTASILHLLQCDIIRIIFSGAVISGETASLQTNFLNIKFI